MAGIRECLGHIALRGLAGDVLHGGRAEFGREGFARFGLVLKLDDTEEAVTELGELFGDELGELVLPAMSEDPTANHERCENRTQRGAGDEDAKSN